MLAPHWTPALLGAVASVFLSALPAQAAPILRAHVQFVGKVPRMGVLKRTDPACGGNKFATEEDVMVGPSGGLRNVLIYVSRGAPPGGKPRDAELTSQACMLRPRVSAVTQGAMIKLSNADAVSHLWHAFVGVKTSFMDNPLAGGQPLIKEVKHNPGEFLRLRDDTHPWMAGFVMVTDNPWFGVTNDAGDVLILDVPSGAYTVTAWHERYGAKSAQVTVAANGYADVKFAFDGQEPKP